MPWSLVRVAEAWPRGIPGHAHGESASGDCGAYSWSQDGETVNVEVVVPAETRGKDVVCVIGSQSLSIEACGLLLNPNSACCVVLDVSAHSRCRGHPISAQVSTLPEGSRSVLNGTLESRVTRNACSWSIVKEAGKVLLQVTLTKAETFKDWSAVLQH